MQRRGAGDTQCVLLVCPYRMDHDGNGKIDYSEFASVLKARDEQHASAFTFQSATAED